MERTIKINREKLLTYSRNYEGPVASGNTNLTVTAYTEALEIASQTSRKVAFIKWYQKLFYSMMAVFKRIFICRERELPVMSLSELYRRNIIRFLQSGRYVPCHTLEEHCRRVSDLYKGIVKCLCLCIRFLKGNHIVFSN